MAEPNSIRKRTNFNNLTEEQILAHKKAKKSEASKRYREKYKESVLAKKKSYREANKEKVSLGKKEWYKRNSEKVIQRVKEYSSVNKELISQKKKIYRLSRSDKHKSYMNEYYLANKNYLLESSKVYRKINRPKINALNRKRIASKVNATPIWFENEKIKALYIEAAKLKHHVDHVVPLINPIVCGLHVLANLQILTPIENMKKGNRHWPDMP
jgi:hypothetical protein